MQATERRSLPVGASFRSSVPNRLDRLPWSKWHVRVVFALGITWILDGLESTLVGAVASVLGEDETLALSATQIGWSGSVYLLGAIIGALVFGRLTDRYGRKKLFLVTLTLYLVSTLLSGLSIGFWMFALFRALTGAGIGGEYAAINSAIDELIPARLRGRVDLAVNGTYWLGTMLGAMTTVVLLDARVVPHSIGWRLCFVLGSALGLLILFVRRHVPESPRWLLLHGKIAKAREVVEEIEDDVKKEHQLSPAKQSKMLVKGSVSFKEIADVLFRKHRRRSVLGLVLVVSQAFAYNGVFFTYALVLARFYGVPGNRVGYYILPFALTNVLGPLVLGPLFDTKGRRVMIPLTYGGAGIALAITGYLFAHGMLDVTKLTICWSIVAFIASTAASSAYLTVSELFPVELRGMAIALFYALGTGIGGVFAPAIFGALVETRNKLHVAEGYWAAAALLVVASLTALWLGVAAEGKSLEQLSGVESEHTK